MKPAGLFAIFLVAVLLASGVAAHAQQTAKVPRIGYLSLAAKATPRDEAFVKQLRDLGWVDGQNIAIEYRWAANKAENLATLADELVGLKVDIIAAGTTPAVHAAKNAASEAQRAIQACPFLHDLNHVVSVELAERIK
jgi:putative tryptophan/tyrosine transport system substrate-binding protein